ncbi:flagellar basal body rod protein FlgB [Dechloromonas sp. ARDL1]|uniref:flagellar basal body rod protein FlgB n=1 Tax=Dechloromonas sp. ARDL1 TaxID=3322121 RepID=UPI003DA6E3CE
MADVPSVLSLLGSIPSLPVQSEQELQGDSEGDASNGTFSQALNQAIAQKIYNSGASRGTHGGLVAAMASGTVVAHPNHFSIGQDAQAGHDFQQQMLGVRAYRQQLLASNIANADTPGYKALDIDIEEAAQIVKGRSASLPMAITAAGHLAATMQSPPFPLKFHLPYQATADGNTVEMDVERQKFAENSLMYQFSMDRVSGHFRHFTELLQNLK